MRYLAAVAVFLCVTIVFSAAKIRDVGDFRGDTAIFFQTTENIAKGLGPMSQVFANTQAMQGSRMATATAEQIDDNPLLPPAVDTQNVLRFHAYYILYPLAFLTYVIPVNVLLLSLCVVSFVAVIFMAFVALREKHVGLGATIAFCALVTMHPIWVQGLLHGQFFPDRFFLLLGFSYVLALTRLEPNRTWQLLAAFGCALIGERAALYAGAFTLLYLLFYRRSDLTDRTFKLVLGTALAATGLLLLRFGIANSEYASFLPTSLGQAIAFWQRHDFALKALLFLLVNSPLLILALFEWRACAIAAIGMLPNLLGNIGGAEKIGWSTHYHDYYFPILVWAAARGFAELQKRPLAWNRIRPSYAVLAVSIVLASMVDPTSIPIRALASPISDNALILAPRTAIDDLGPNGTLELRDSDAIASEVPTGAVVSTTETGMPFLYRDRIIRFFPIGVDRADYALLGATHNADGTFTYSGAINFLGANELAKVNTALTRRMKRDGYDLDHPQFFAPFGVAILKRLH